jgi:hypothetical protein
MAIFDLLPCSTFPFFLCPFSSISSHLTLLIFPLLVTIDLQWPLALGIYLDCADLTVTLLGFHDDMSLHAWRAVTEVSNVLHGVAW